MNSKKELLKEFIGFTGFFYFLPLILLYFGVLPFSTRHIILIIMGIIMIAYASDKPFNLKRLGISKDNLGGSFLYNGILTIGALIALFFIGNSSIIPPSYVVNSLWFYFFYVFISAPMQEFVFRSLMFAELDIFIKGKGWLKVLISASVYSLAHAFYHNLWVLGATFVIGIFWGYIYLKKPNFWGVATSHAILGAVTIFFGLI